MTRCSTGHSHSGNRVTARAIKVLHAVVYYLYFLLLLCVVRGGMYVYVFLMLFVCVCICMCVLGTLNAINNVAKTYNAMHRYNQTYIYI